MQIWATPVMLNNADKKWALQRDYLDGLMRQQHLQQVIAWLSPSELFSQTTDALCHTNANLFSEIYGEYLELPGEPYYLFQRS